MSNMHNIVSALTTSCAWGLRKFPIVGIRWQVNIVLYYNVFLRVCSLKNASATFRIAIKLAKLKM